VKKITGKVRIIYRWKLFAKNSESKWLDLKGDRRCVKAVAVLGKTKNQASQQALVQFYGR
jgi:hypothetical protein